MVLAQASQPGQLSGDAARGCRSGVDTRNANPAAALNAPFDGVSWSEAPVQPRQSLVEKEEASNWMHLNERTLRRYLREAGTSYQAIHDRVRRDAAEALLAGSAANIAAVGAAIGFHDPREFRRAFKRWTGMAPRAARPRH